MFSLLEENDGDKKENQWQTFPKSETPGSIASESCIAMPKPSV